VKAKMMQMMNENPGNDAKDDGIKIRNEEVREIEK